MKLLKRREFRGVVAVALVIPPSLKALLLVHVLCAWPPAAGADAPDARFSVEDIFREASRERLPIDSVKAEYDIEWERLLDAPSLRERRVALDPDHVVFRVRGEHIYCDRSTTKLSADGSRRSSAFLGAFDGKQSVVLFSGTAFLQQRRDPRCDGGGFYCSEFLQIPYTDNDRLNVARGIEEAFPSCIAPDSKYAAEVLPAQEKVGPAWCHVVSLENGDRYWVDPQIGFAVRKRERSRFVSGHPPIALARYEMADFVDVGGSRFLPRECVRYTFGEPSDPPKFWDTPVLKMTLRVRNVSINDASDEDFSVKLKPGTKVFVLDESGQKKKEYVVRGDADVLLKRYSDLAKKEIGHMPQPNPWRLAFVCVNIFALALLFSWLVWRGRARRSAQPPGR